ncbi:hypothetical protein [Rhodococcoides yunnanense]|uniref:Uncharacterized protein n=1 Tax=Rhodococcoides yunnanense TaxID=278209 RepID=A0ABU4BGQ2_9NOCA|nr:hypothetical protein [Rhodococcus yunnanensis]MDV6263387.1 hypothetical protein [Rhodococcus yunnanensis]
MSAAGGWRRELHRIREEHRDAMARAAEALRQAQTPTAVSGRHDSHTVSPVDPDVEPTRGSVLQPAHLDRRKPVPPVETEPEDRPRSWLV